MSKKQEIPKIPLPKGWKKHVRTAVLHVISLAQSTTIVAAWMKRLQVEWADALVQLDEPVNRFPDFVRYIVQQLKTLCPGMGKRKLAETLARAGLHLGVTTVGRILKEAPAPTPQAREEVRAAGRVVTAKHPSPPMRATDACNTASRSSPTTVTGFQSSIASAST